MADVKWIKIVTDIFDDEKILLIESLPSADSIIVIWFKLLTLAGKHNNDGVFIMSGRIPYTDEMLATIFRRDVNTVRLALKTFENFGMIEIIEGVITIPNWNKHQTLDAYEKKKERDRLYQAQKRAKQKAIIAKSSDTSSDTSSDVVVTEEDKERDKEEDKEGLNNKLLKNLTTGSEKIKEQEVEKLYGNNNKEKITNNNKSNREQVPYQRIIDSFNDICTSFPKVKSLSDSRKKAIKARLNTYSVEQIIEAFRKAEASDFLKGKNNRDWQASFDWIMKDANIAKVLDGNYDNKGMKEKDNSKDDPNYELKQQMIALMTGKGV